MKALTCKSWMKLQSSSSESPSFYRKLRHRAKIGLTLSHMARWRQSQGRSVSKRLGPELFPPVVCFLPKSNIELRKTYLSY